MNTTAEFIKQVLSDIDCMVYVIVRVCARIWLVSTLKIKQI